MTEKDLARILEACLPVPVMMIGGYLPESVQARANRAWAELGFRMGFQPETVRPLPDKGQRFFSAVPSETELQRKERLDKQALKSRKAEIATIRERMRKDQQLLDVLENQ